MLLYPDRPYGLGTLYGFRIDKETGERERFIISEPADLDESYVYAKERRLIEEIKSELAQGRNVQVFAVYTQKRDVTGRLQELLRKEGIRAEVLTAETPPEQRESWYERQLQNGMQVCICHPKLVQTGLDLLPFPTIFFVQTGYSIYTLRQASRRSWRIGQREPVRVTFFTYSNTAQENCLRLMGKKLLVSLAMEGKLHVEGLQTMDQDDDLLTAMARELVTRQGVGERAAEGWRALTKINQSAAESSGNVEAPRPQLPETSKELEPKSDSKEAILRDFSQWLQRTHPDLLKKGWLLSEISRHRGSATHQSIAKEFAEKMPGWCRQIIESLC